VGQRVINGAGTEDKVISGQREDIRHKFKCLLRGTMVEVLRDREGSSPFIQRSQCDW